MAPPDHAQKKKRAVGAGLSLDKFATLGVSKFDKRQKLERIKKQKIIQHSKLSKLKKKLEAQGVLASTQVKDSVAELEALDGGGLESPGEEEDADRPASHAQAGPGPQKQGHGRHGRAELAEAPQPGALLRKARPSAAAERSEKEGRSGGTLRAPHHRTGHTRPDAKDGEGAKLRPQKRQRANSGEDPGGGGGDDAVEGGQPGSEGHRHGGKGHSNPSRLHRLVQKVAEEKAEKQRAKEAAMKEREERMRRVAAVEKERKEQKHLHFKRTAKGQPLMRYRMEKLLSQIQKTV